MYKAWLNMSWSKFALVCKIGHLLLEIIWMQNELIFFFDDLKEGVIMVKPMLKWFTKFLKTGEEIPY